MKEKILFFITDSFPYGKGETFIENEIIYLGKSFHKVFILPLSFGKNTIFREVPVNTYVIHRNTERTHLREILLMILLTKGIAREFIINLFTNPLRNKVLIMSLLGAITISKEIEKWATSQHDKELYCYSYWFNDAAIALALSRINAVKICRAHGWDVYQQRHLYHYLPLRKFTAKRLDGIFTISEDGQRELVRQAGSDNIFLSRLGTINNSVGKVKNSNSESILQVITIGNAIPLKRLQLVGEALLLQDKNIVKWTHYGDGPLLGPLKGSYPFAHFKGWISNADLKNDLERLAGNALLINTSASEGIPVSMMEAMSYGIPCIGTRVGGVPEIITDGFNGYLLNSNPEPREITEKINNWLKLHEEQKTVMKNNAFSFWERKYNGEKNYAAFVNLLQNL